MPLLSSFWLYKLLLYLLDNFLSKLYSAQSIAPEVKNLDLLVRQNIPRNLESLRLISYKVYVHLLNIYFIKATIPCLLVLIVSLVGTRLWRKLLPNQSNLHQPFTQKFFINTISFPNKLLFSNLTSI